MKTNVTMESKKSRELYGVTIRQETKDSFLSLTDLQEAYTRARVLNGWSRKDIQHDILASKKNSERIYYLLKEQNIVNDKYCFFDSVKTYGIIKTLKKLNQYKCYGRGTDKSVFCNKFIWLLVCQELSASFYAEVIKYLFTENFNSFDFVSFDTSEYETTQQARINHENAWRYFFPDGKGVAKKGYCLHHINPDWRYNDIERYNQWNVDDLQMLTFSEHWILHQKIGFGKSKDLQMIEAINLTETLRSAMTKLPNPDYRNVNYELNMRIFGRHEAGIRNTGSTEELRKLYRLEDNIAYCIDNGFYKSNEDVINAIKTSKIA